MDPQLLLDVLRWQQRRVAARLHDGPIQDLTASHLFLDAAMDAPTPAADLLDGAMNSLQRSVAGARGLMREMNDVPSVAEAGERIVAMAAPLLDGTVPDVSLPASVLDDEETHDRAAVQQRTAAWILLLAAEELLSNVRRHADGRLVSLRAWAEDDRFFLEVVDAGPGGCPEPAGRGPGDGGPGDGGPGEDHPGPGGLVDGRLGLRALAGLTRAGGGTVKVHSGEDGTCVLVTVPASSG